MIFCKLLIYVLFYCFGENDHETLKNKNNNLIINAISIELAFLKKIMLIKQVNQISAIFVTIGIFSIKALNFNQMTAIVVMIY